MRSAISAAVRSGFRGNEPSQAASACWVDGRQLCQQELRIFVRWRVQALRQSRQSGVILNGEIVKGKQRGNFAGRLWLRRVRSVRACRRRRNTGQRNPRQCLPRVLSHEVSRGTRRRQRHTERQRLLAENGAKQSRRYRDARRLATLRALRRCGVRRDRTENFHWVAAVIDQNHVAARHAHVLHAATIGRWLLRGDAQRELERIFRSPLDLDNRRSVRLLAIERIDSWRHFRQPHRLAMRRVRIGSLARFRAEHFLKNQDVANLQLQLANASGRTVSRGRRGCGSRPNRGLSRTRGRCSWCGGGSCWRCRCSGRHGSGWRRLSARRRRAECPAAFRAESEASEEPRRRPELPMSRPAPGSIGNRPRCRNESCCGQRRCKSFAAIPVQRLEDFVAGGIHADKIGGSENVVGHGRAGIGSDEVNLSGIETSGRCRSRW